MEKAASRILPEDDGRKAPETSVSQSKKAPRVNGGGEIRRVAETVMVLSAFGKMRGGARPSGRERKMMAEAREKLAMMCEPVVPKDLVSRDLARAVKEDLGLGSVRDLELRSSSPKMLIAEKVSLTMRKMKEPKEFTAQSAMNSSEQMQVAGGSYLDNKRTQSEEGAVCGHCRLDKPLSLSLSAEASSSANVLPEKPTFCSSQSPSVLVDKVVEANKPVQAPLLYNSHNDIARYVEKTLRPNIPRDLFICTVIEDLPENFTCQVCQVSIIDIETELICDNCEKGFHLKCLQPCLPKGIPEGEWYCRECLVANNWMPLPRKYGRVFRNAHSSSNSQASSEKKMANPVQKASSHLKAIANAKPESLKRASMVGIGPADGNIKPLPDR